MENQRNLILAVVLCGLLLLGWDMAVREFYPEPAPTEEIADATQAAAPAVASRVAPRATAG